MNTQQDNPFKAGVYQGVQTYTIDAADRVRAVKGFDLAKCRAALQITGLQKSVENALRARMRKLLKEVGVHVCIHHLKADPSPFQAMWDGVKQSEVRFNDRGYLVGDVVNLQETVHPAEAMRLGGAPLQYTGRAITRQITHVQAGYGLQDGWVVLSLGERAA